MPADEEPKVATERAASADGSRATLQQTSLRQYQLDQVQRVAMPLARRWPLSPLAGLP